MGKNIYKKSTDNFPLENGGIEVKTVHISRFGPLRQRILPQKEENT